MGEPLRGISSIYYSNTLFHRPVRELSAEDFRSIGASGRVPSCLTFAAISASTNLA